ncbi:hypothetical protein [Ornithinimicrobium flavum]|uniref:hypothetical protein n=1 Tax=Ornithinimicrobium flavum TaxID=1288636 RepID=UPI001070110C|nr:hypothetical protein [Ornithinimicrobium flavum]
MSGHVLPASVRVALWGTAALAGRVPVAKVPERALPDLDACTGLREQLGLWRDLGERVVLVALPRAGDVTGLPRGGPDLLAAATRAQECVLVPGLGGALVPHLEQFGPPGDRGWSVRWEAFPADPLPTHRVEALDLGQVELGLRAGLAEQTAVLTAVGGVPFGGGAETSSARARAAVRTGTLGGSWGLPDGVPPRAARVVDLAGTVLELADAGLDDGAQSLDAGTTTTRTRALRDLQAAATRALADATNAAALALAGWR